MNGQYINLQLGTQYPWEGDVKIQMDLDAPQVLTLYLRVPGWCDQWTIHLNGVPVPDLKPRENGYLALDREWHSGDVVKFNMEMPVRTIWANPAVRQLQGRLALQRGPLVYCLEGCDHGSFVLDRIAIDPQVVSAQDFNVEHQAGLLGGVTTIRGNGVVIDDLGWDDRLYRFTPPSSKRIEFTAIPYYGWDNRDPGDLRVWIRST
jgi:DUF1680 family protein